MDVQYVRRKFGGPSSADEMADLEDVDNDSIFYTIILLASSVHWDTT